MNKTEHEQSILLISYNLPDDIYLTPNYFCLYIFVCEYTRYILLGNVRAVH